MGCGASHSAGPYRPDGSRWPYDCFISYRNGCDACKKFCQELKNELESPGPFGYGIGKTANHNGVRLKCFFDAGVLAMGDDWESKIGSGLKGCKSMAIVVCEGYGCTEWTTKEAERADKLGIPIWPLWHCGAYPPTGCSAQVASILSKRQRAPREFPLSDPVQFMAADVTQAPPGPCMAADVVRSAYVSAQLCDTEQEATVKGVTTPGQYGAPAGQYGAPAGQYGAPAGQYGAPAGQYGAPAGGYPY